MSNSNYDNYDINNEEENVIKPNDEEENEEIYRDHTLFDINNEPLINLMNEKEILDEINMFMKNISIKKENEEDLEEDKSEEDKNNKKLINLFEKGRLRRQSPHLSTGHFRTININIEKKKK